MSAVQTAEGLMYRVYGAGKGKSTSVLLELNMAARVAMQVWYVESKGGTLYLTEGNRPRGVPSDRLARNESQTASGVSTQYFQHGRYLRGETPSAINPDVRDSNHTGGRALDSNAPTARDMQLRAEGAYLAGLVFNVPSESWHQEPLATPKSDLGPWLTFVAGAKSVPSVTPKSNYPLEDNMLLLQQSDGEKKIFAYQDGAYHILSLEQVSAIQALLRAMKLDDKAIQLPSSYITHISEAARNASGNYHLRAQLDAVNAKLAAIEKKLG